MALIKLDLKQNPYDIIIEENALNYILSYLHDITDLGKKIFIICDENSKKYYLEQIETLLKQQYIVKTITIKSGEQSKSFESSNKICNEILSYKPVRNDTIIALGGGVVGDLAGFCASIILRGINFIQIPTTLLAQVDSSVGGKTGVNSKYGKNLIGAFYQPRLVLIDTNTIKTLPEREFLCGYVEAMKYALIDNHIFFEFLEGQKEQIINRNPEILAEIIKISCQSKACLLYTSDAADES